MQLQFPRNAYLFNLSKKEYLIENDKAAHRSITWYLWKSSKKGAEIHRELQRVCQDSAPSERTIQRWIEEFKSGHEEIQMGSSTGRPSTATSPENIAQAEDLIADDRRITIATLSDHLGISYGSARSIIVDQLHLSKLTCRWIPKCLTPDMKATRVGTSQDLLRQYEESPEQFLSRLVTGDEKWFYYWEPDSKQQSKEWREVGSPHPLSPEKKDLQVNEWPVFSGTWRELFSLSGYLKTEPSMPSTTAIY